MQSEIIKLLQQIWPEYEIDNRINEESAVELLGAVRREAASAPTLADLASIRITGFPPEGTDIQELSRRFAGKEQFQAYLNNRAARYLAGQQQIIKLDGTPGLASIKECRSFKNGDGSSWLFCSLMERVTPLSAYTQGQNMSEDEIVKLGSELCATVAECGAKGVRNIDVHPNNICVDVQGNYKLFDLGTESAAFDGANPENYLPPESAAGGAHNNTWETYSIGLILYRLLNEDRLPFVKKGSENDPESRRMAQALRMRGEILPPPCKASPAMSRVLLKACAPDPARRFASPTDMIAALNNPQGERLFAVVPPVMPQGIMDEKTVAMDDYGRQPMQRQDRVNNGPNRQQSSGAVPPDQQTAQPVPPAGNGAFAPQNQPNAYQPEPEQTKKKGSVFKTLLIILLIAFILALLGTAAYFGYRLVTEGFGNKDRINDDDETPVPTSQSGMNGGDDGMTTPEPTGSVFTTPAPTGTDTTDEPETYAPMTDIYVTPVPGEATPSPTDDMEETPMPTEEPNETPWPSETQQPTSSPTIPYVWSSDYNFGLDIGHDHVVGLLENGRCVAAGNDTGGKCGVSGWTDIIQVAAAENFSAGLRRDGRVMFAGIEPEINVNNVRSWQNIVQISAHGNALVALDADGYVFVEGIQAKHDPNDPATHYNIPVDVTSLYGAKPVFVSAGRDHILILFADGTVRAFGNTDSGRCAVDGWRNIVGIVACQAGSIGIRADGTIVYTGGTGHNQGELVALANSGMRFDIIASKGYHFVYIDMNGRVGCVGYNDKGRCDVDHWNRYTNKYVVAVAASQYNTAALFSDGSVEFVGHEAYNASFTDGLRTARQNHRIVKSR